MPKSINYIEKIVELLNSIDPALVEMCYPVLTHEKFAFWPAAVRKHHAYYGGLAKHTYEVLVFAIAAAGPTKADKRVVALACVWHDLGKLWDYKFTAVNHSAKTIEGVEYTPQASEIGHLVLSYEKYKEFISQNYICVPVTERRDNLPGFVYDTRFHEQVLHCIIAHHGRKEWGSPREPQTIEALLVHHADCISVIHDTGNSTMSRDLMTENKRVTSFSLKGSDLTPGDIVHGVPLVSLMNAQGKPASQEITAKFIRLDTNGCPLVEPTITLDVKGPLKMPLRSIRHVVPSEDTA